jgi:hypothetical protein
MKIINIGDTLWTMVNNKPRERTVKSVNSTNEWVRFSDGRLKLLKYCFTSLDELMDDLRTKAEYKKDRKNKTGKLKRKAGGVFSR